ncbi:MAG: polysaccharide deacetylase family protein, partial [Anaerovorax sp.]
MGVYIYKRGIKKIAVVLGGIIVCALILNVTIFNEEFSMATVTGADRKLPIYCVDVTEKKIAISFDAAWGNEHTKPILDILDKYEVKTTFFLVEFWVDKFPEEVREISKRGHELGNHSSTHPNMPELSAHKMQQELKGVEGKIVTLTGKKPTVFRPPFGAYDNQLMEVAKTNGYQVIQWSVDSLDWKKISSEQIVERVCRNVRPGSIVLFHNNAEHVERYLPLILETLKADGYSIVP